MNKAALRVAVESLEREVAHALVTTSPGHVTFTRWMRQLFRMLHSITYEPPARVTVEIEDGRLVAIRSDQPLDVTIIPVHWETIHHSDLWLEEIATVDASGLPTIDPEKFPHTLYQEGGR